MASRRVKTDAERAADELAIYEKRLSRVRKARDVARAAYDAAESEYESVLAVRNHLRAHPALPKPEPTDDEISLGEHPGLLDDEPLPHEYVESSSLSEGSRCGVPGCGADVDDPAHTYVPAGVGG